MTTKNCNKILFIHPNLSTFIRVDYEILSKSYDVQLYHYTQSKKMSHNLIQQFYLLIWFLKNSRNLHCIYIWFADYHAFLPVFLSRLLGKRSYISLGGYDTARLPELDYGAYKNPVRAFCASYAIGHATLNLPVSPFLAKEARELVPGANIAVFPFGFSGYMFFPSGKMKEPIVLTIGIINSAQRVKIKGIDYFIEVARHLREYRFIIIGVTKEGEKYLGDLPENIDVFGLIPHEELLHYYQRAKVYAQFSIREGLPNTVCEAMLCECIPVGLNNGGIPYAIGDAGFIIDNNEITAAASAVKQAIEDKTKLGQKARKFILHNYSQEKRTDGLLNIIEKNQIPEFTQN
jgi:glycosyltransferase involved in cell wall biosynthesis